MTPVPSAAAPPLLDYNSLSSQLSVIPDRGKQVDEQERAKEGAYDGASEGSAAVLAAAGGSLRGVCADSLDCLTGFEDWIGRLWLDR